MWVISAININLCWLLFKENKFNFTALLYSVLPYFSEFCQNLKMLHEMLHVKCSERKLQIDKINFIL